MKKFHSLLLSAIFFCTIFVSASFAQRPVSYDAVFSEASTWGAMDCRKFANKFLQEKLGRSALPSSNNDPYTRRFNSVPSGYTLLGSHLNDEYGTGPTQQEIANIFDQASPGDIVLMYWDTSYTDESGTYHEYQSSHTAIISDVTKGSSVEFLHSNFPYGSAPCNATYSYSTLFNCMKYQKFADHTGIGGAGGFSVYHYGNATPSPPANYIAINETNFPDPNFRYYVSTYSDCDEDQDGFLSPEEIATIAWFGCYGMGISNLKGIEYFTALQELNCYGNKLTTLDISKNPALEGLSCQDNQLTTLNISKNSALQYLNCWNNQLTTLDVSKNSALKILYCYNNKLTMLDVSKNSALQYLDCSDNQLTKLTLGTHNYLYFLNCKNNKLTEIDVSGCPLLTDENIHCDSDVTIIRDGNNTSEDTAPKITTTSLNSGRVGVDYSFTMQASGTTPITWSAKSLPNGLRINSKTGEIYSKPKKAGTFNVTVTAKNKFDSDSKTFSLLINPAIVMPKITTSSLKSGNTDKDYSVQLKASGTVPLKWTSTTLPQNFSLDEDTGVLSGNTPEIWDSKITFFVTDSIGNVASKDLKLTIKGVNPKITTNKLDNAYQDKSYEVTLQATGTAPINWSATGLPEGLEIDPSIGKISGTPNASGKFNKVKITASNPMKAVTKNFTINVIGYPTITTTSLKSGTINKSYNVTAKAKAFGATKFVWFALGLPKGLSMAITTGKISGKPEEAGIFEVIIIAGIPDKDMIDEKHFQLEIKDNNKAKKTTISLSEAKSQSENMNQSFESENQSLVLIGEERSEENLTQKELSQLEGYTIAAVLPEIKVTESGQYDFEISLDENIESNAKLFWFAFPENEISNDDEIVEFYNLSGEEIDSVPDEKFIIVSPWLNQEIIYRPVIAVKSSL